MSHPLLEVTDVVVDHGGVRALDGVSLAVHAGEVAGLIGPNGAGKTTLVDVVTGFTPATAGSVRFDGVELEGVTAHRRARAGLVRTFQSLELFEDLTVAGNLAVAVPRPGGAARRLTAALADAVRPRPAPTADPAVGPVVAAALDQVGLGALAGHRPESLSNGQRHLVALARALAARPRLVCLDEPAAGLDPAETAELARVVAAVAANGTAVVLVDHDMDLVLGVCDVVHVLDVGRRIAVGTPAEVRADPLVRQAYLGTGLPGATGGPHG